jgi:hypothetical protein
MKRSVILPAAILLSLPVISTFALRSGHRPTQAPATANASQSSDSGTPANQSMSKLNACSPPNRVMPSIEETAWRLWVAATCPVNQNQYPYVVWENWIEQDQLYALNPAKGLKVPNALAQLSGTTQLLHASPLTLAGNPSLGTTVPGGLLGEPDQNCNRAHNPPSNQPNLVFCEKVRLNGATEDYIARRSFWNRAGQQRAALANADIQFPADSVEIKVDWIQLSSIGLDCNNLPAGFSQSVHVEMIHGNCFALAGMHLMSKLTKNWIWATFEAQNLTTNPNRCKELGCTDHFGSNPPRTNGSNTQLTSKLANLMAAANLAPEWRNYRLDGVRQILPTTMGIRPSWAIPLSREKMPACPHICPA